MFQSSLREVQISYMKVFSPSGLHQILFPYDILYHSKDSLDTFL